MKAIKPREIGSDKWFLGVSGEEGGEGRVGMGIWNEEWYCRRQEGKSGPPADVVYVTGAGMEGSSGEW